MKQNDLLKVAIRQNAIYISENSNIKNEISATTYQLASQLAKLGFGIPEKVLHQLNGQNPAILIQILETFQEILGIDKNWTPLVKNWSVPTGESNMDHIVTFFANLFKSENGVKLNCGHLIPNGTFPLERYNGCPFCGTPFQFGEIENFGQNTKLKVLNRWNEKDFENFLKSLLTSKTALDATQIDSLKTLLTYFPLPKVEVQMKETLMVVIQQLIAENKEIEVQQFLKTPTDILRYLWFQKTGFLQIIEPKNIIKRLTKNSKNLAITLDESSNAGIFAKENLKLKYSRKEGLMIAKWLNDIEMKPEQVCENMHPKRRMWVRFIRTLRLPEISRREGFEHLKLILDCFYNQNYEVWQGRVNHFRLKADAENTFKLLKQRPGLFARSLFANMLWFGEEETTKHFKEIVDQLPTRLVLTLNSYAENYFDPENERSVKPLGGTNKRISANPLLKLFEKDHLEIMKNKVEEITFFAIKEKFSKEKNENRSIYIDPQLFNIPLSIGDRSENIQDLPSALMGTKFPVEGNVVRLFMQWGKDLPAQHLDMDLSCHIAFENRVEVCSYFNLQATGCKHSGDIQQIPDKIGTAEYIEINLEKLQNAGAKFVSFTSNAYSNGSLTPNMVIGWMNAEFPMKISKKTGVAYDPSCVQHQIKITKGLNKGLVFGVLEVEKREIIWLEMSFSGQTIQSLDDKGIQAMIRKLSGKMSIGNLLKIKAEAQNLEIIEAESADEIYDLSWVSNPAKVTELFIS